MNEIRNFHILLVTLTIKNILPLVLVSINFQMFVIVSDSNHGGSYDRTIYDNAI